MTAPNAWSTDPERSGDGVAVYRLGAWSEFSAFLGSIIFRPEHAGHRFVWRGQRRADWSLDTSLDRLFDRIKPEHAEEKAREHLDNFRYAIRGRRGNNPAALNDDALWAIGQHYGLATPLLDWTRSPYAAAYFAFEASGADDTDHRAIVALNRDLVAFANTGLATEAAKLESSIR